MTALPKNPVNVDLHVGDDTTANGDLSCWCTNRKGKLIEPIKVDKKNSNQDGIEFRLKNKEYEFVGFMSPQDRSHHCFEVVDMFDVEYEYEDGEKDGLYSFMTVEDKFCPTETLFDYELVFRKKNGLPEGNLYRYDPQIKNEN